MANATDDNWKWSRFEIASGTPNIVRIRPKLRWRRRPEDEVGSRKMA